MASATAPAGTTLLHIFDASTIYTLSRQQVDFWQGSTADFDILNAPILCT